MQPRRPEAADEATAAHDAFADEATAAGAGGDSGGAADEPAGGHAGAVAAGEPTGPVGSTDPWEGQEDDLAPTASQGGEPTELISPVGAAPDATSVIPPAPEDPRWSARAEVPTRPRGATPPAQWDGYQEPEGGRAWWLPIVLGIIGLLVLAAIAIGAYLLRQDGEGTPTPTPSATPTSAARTTTSASPSPSATSATPSRSAFPALPNLRGKTQAEAEAYLQQNSIAYVIELRETTEAAPGIVVDTDPLPDALITPGTVVKVFVAKAPPSPSESPTTPSETSTSTPTP
jgi:hypothetical protein